MTANYDADVTSWFRNNARLTSWPTLMAYFVLSQYLQMVKNPLINS